MIYDHFYVSQVRAYRVGFARIPYHQEFVFVHPLIAICIEHVEGDAEGRVWFWCVVDIGAGATRSRR